MNAELQNKILQYTKSQKDISELIKDQDLHNADLSHAIISNFNVSNQDISNCRLVGAKIQHATLIHTIAHNVQFNYCDMSYSNCSYLDARDSNFLNANCAFVKFTYADLRGCNFCDVTMTLSPKWAYKAKFSKNMLDLLRRIWDITEDNTEAKLCEET
jgi:uncharacterized protein YjbI with pentapeptide repeats